jgi:VanZ family protein
MNFDINVTAGLVAGLVAMVPGSLIYAPSSPTGKAWMREVKTKSKYSPLQAMSLMLVASLITGLIASLFVSTTGAQTVADALDVCLLLMWFPISVNLAQTFFEGRSWSLAGIGVLNQVLTFAVIGVVLGLFL